MNKNIMKIFLLTFFILVFSISLVSANDVTNNTADNGVVSADNSVKNVDKEASITNDKLSDSEINYYVSDTNGSDTNQGTQSSPFKTIQTALNKTTNTATYNIHITAGTYKGVGNTNLTVNGNNTINLIGDGINKTVLDGEVNYTISGASVWGQSEYWDYYNIYSGNWGLNITSGTGKISISNLNIQNMVSHGSNSIFTYPTATVDNYGNLEVDNVYFYKNLAGVGAGIRNNGGATVIVNNSVFEANRKASSTGNFGSAIYNNGTCVVDNTLFKDNAARWGVVTNDYLLNLSNSVMQGGISYDLSSSFKFGSGIVSNTETADMNQHYTVVGAVTNVVNTTFINNGQTDIYQGVGDLLVDNCSFINSTGVYLLSAPNNTRIIQNSSFKDMIPSTLFTTLSSKTALRFAVYASSNIIVNNTSIDFSDSGYAIRTDSNSTITNSNLTNQIVLTGSNNNLTNNTINTKTEYTINVTGSNNNIKNNTLTTNVLTGNKSILSRSSTNLIENNIPESGSEYILTESNYSEFFDENGIIKTDNIENGSIITLGSNLSNKNLIFENIKLYFTNPSSHTLYNTTITLKNTSNIILDQIRINNENTNKEYVISVESNFTIIKSSRINLTTNNNIKTIIIKSDETNLYDNILEVYGNSEEITGIDIESKENVLSQNRIYLNNSNTDGVLKGIYVNGTNSNTIEGFIYADGTNETTGINLINSNNNYLNLFIYTNSTKKATSIELTNSNDNYFLTRTIETIAPTSYGIIENNSINNEFRLNSIAGNGTNTTGILSTNSNNTIFSAYNYYYTIAINGTHVRGVKLLNNTNSEVSYAKINTLRKATTNTNLTAVELVDSNNLYLYNVTMITNGTVNIAGTFLVLNNTNNTYFSNENMETNRAITLTNSNNNTITKLRITTTTTTVITLTNSSNNNISNNYLNGNNDLGGNDTIRLTNSTDNILENNIPRLVLLTNDNYNEYFQNNTLDFDVIELTLYSNLYERNMIFDHPVKINNPNNYTMYNCTITGTYDNATGTIKLINLIMNSTNNKTTLISTIRGIQINETKIYHENKEDIVQTIKIIDPITGTLSYTSQFFNSTLISIGQEKTDNITCGIWAEYTMNVTDSNITVRINNNGNGTVIGLYYGKRIGVVGISSLRTNINVTAYNNAIGIYNAYQISYTNLTVTSQNNTTGIQTTRMFNGRYNNIYVNGNNTAVLLANSATTWNQLTYNNITINSTSNQSIFVASYQKNETVANAGIDINYNNFTSNVPTTVYIENTTYLRQIQYNNFNNTQIILQNASSQITYNNITNNNSGAIVTLINSTGSIINNNYFNSTGLKGNYAISLINSTSNTYQNTPITDIITNDNYDTYFTDGILTKELADMLIIGEDLYNKTMIFNKTVIIENPNNYTLYNSTIYITENSTTKLNNINMINTDSKILTSIESKGLLNLANSTIYQENNNASVNVIHINSTNTNSNSILYNNITLKGNGTIIKVETARTSTRYNNISGDGDNITAINIENRTVSSRTQVSYNNITLKSDNPTTAIRYTNIQGVQTTYNKIIIKANNNGTPIINITSGLSSNTVNNNYLESYDSYGISTIVKTGTATISDNNEPSGTFNTTMNIDTQKEMYINDTIIININTTDMLDRPINSGILEVTYNNQTTNITVNDSIITYTFTPTISGINTIDFTFTPTNTSYLATNKTISIEITKYNTTINMTNITGKINKTTIITPQVIDELLNNVTDGNITVSDENGTILANSTVSNGTSNLNFKFNTTGNKTLIITYAGTDKYEESTVNIIATITKLNTTITVDKIVGIVGESITLIAYVIDEQGDNVTSGRVQFKINGVTLRDANGNVIYVNVTKGVARLTLTAVRGWTNTGAYISANYAGNSIYHTSTSKNSTVNIAKRNATVEIINDTHVYKAGDTIIITAIVTDSNGQLANSGQVVFKLNGVTLKDRNGKTIMANVVNGIATLTYTLPSTFADYNYTITAIFAGGDYNRQVSKNSTLQVVKTSIHMDLDPVITTTNTAVVKAKIYDGNNKQITGTTRVTIKLNGVTIINSQNITNGNLQFTINTPYPTGLYNMTIIAGPSSVYEQLQRNTTLVIMKN